MTQRTARPWQNGHVLGIHQVFFFFYETLPHLSVNYCALYCEHTQVFFQPLMPFNKLVDHGKVVTVGFICHYPSSCNNLQLPSQDQSGIGFNTQIRVADEENPLFTWSFVCNLLAHCLLFVCIYTLPPFDKVGDLRPDELPAWVLCKLGHHVVQNMLCLVIIIFVKGFNPTCQCVRNSSNHQRNSQYLNDCMTTCPSYD